MLSNCLLSNKFKGPNGCNPTQVSLGRYLRWIQEIGFEAEKRCSLVTVVPFLLTSVAQPSLTLITLANTHKNKLQCSDLSLSLSLSHTHTQTHHESKKHTTHPQVRTHTHSSTHTLARTHSHTTFHSPFFTVGFIWANILFGDGGIDFVHSSRSHGWRNWMNRKKEKPSSWNNFGR